MVSEIILCVKEVNQKTRTAAYELLVSLAKAMHEQHPPPLPALGQDMDMGGSSHRSSPVIALLCNYMYIGCGASASVFGILNGVL